MNLQSHLSSAELLHKSRTSSETCKSCAVVKITKATFKHQTSSASKPFEELHLDLIGPITPLSSKQHKYILTVLDSNTRFVAAIPLVSKSDRLGYYPSILHSDCGTEFFNLELGEYCRKNLIRQRFSDEYTPQQNGLTKRFNRTVIESLRTVMLDSGLRPNLWNEVLSACVLSLNQIPAHKSKKSPYELFKGSSIPLNFFKPNGNPVAVLLKKKNSKLEPRGDFGKLIGLNAELKSYRIRLDDGRIFNSKNVQFLKFSDEGITLADHDKLIFEKKTEERSGQSIPIRKDVDPPESDEINIKEEDVDSKELDHSKVEEEADSSSDNEYVTSQLVPDTQLPVGRILRERTLQVKPANHLQQKIC
ncbi:hypothetical protein VP01_3309g2 [Puccinia sorghi]|uniref:Integrase catalytic domain-containing protein n=1 Tax=Puccinia sorghi TaxID=27349 RepID=A0A0L6UXB5_9BASI|nr:hypothetical protein VP01_3309g2 [Puccinia sorghi]